MRAGLLCGILLVTIYSCRKTPPKQILPPLTQSGEQTLGFFLNGEPWIPYDRGNHEIFELPKPELGKDGSLKISATRIDDTNSSRSWFCIEIPAHCDGAGIYPIASNVCTSPYQVYYYGSQKNRQGASHMIDTLAPHYIEITHLDKFDKTISGQFEFDAISKHMDTVRIRSGRFDLNYADL